MFNRDGETCSTEKNSRTSSPSMTTSRKSFSSLIISDDQDSDPTHTPTPNKNSTCWKIGDRDGAERPETIQSAQFTIKYAGGISWHHMISVVCLKKLYHFFVQDYLNLPTPIKRKNAELVLDFFEINEFSLLLDKLLAKAAWHRDEQEHVTSKVIWPIWCIMPGPAIRADDPHDKTDHFHRLRFYSKDERKLMTHLRQLGVALESFNEDDYDNIQIKRILWLVKSAKEYTVKKKTPFQLCKDFWCDSSGKYSLNIADIPLRNVYLMPSMPSSEILSNVPAAYWVIENYDNTKFYLQHSYSVIINIRRMTYIHPNGACEYLDIDQKQLPNLEDICTIYKKFNRDVHLQKEVSNQQIAQTNLEKFENIFAFAENHVPRLDYQGSYIITADQSFARYHINNATQLTRCCEGLGLIREWVDNVGINYSSKKTFCSAQVTDEQIDSLAELEKIRKRNIMNGDIDIEETDDLVEEIFTPRYSSSHSTPKRNLSPSTRSASIASPTVTKTSTSTSGASTPTSGASTPPTPRPVSALTTTGRFYRSQSQSSLQSINFSSPPRHAKRSLTPLFHQLPITKGVPLPSITSPTFTK